MGTLRRAQRVLRFVSLTWAVTRVLGVLVGVRHGCLARNERSCAGAPGQTPRLRRHRLFAWDRTRWDL